MILLLAGRTATPGVNIILLHEGGWVLRGRVHRLPVGDALAAKQALPILLISNQISLFSCVDEVIAGSSCLPCVQDAHRLVKPVLHFRITLRIDVVFLSLRLSLILVVFFIGVVIELIDVSVCLRCMPVEFYLFAASIFDRAIVLCAVCGVWLI